MTTQSCISGQSFGTGSNIGDGKFSITPKTFAATTTAFIVNVKVTNGTGPVDRQVEVRVWYTSTMRTVTAGNAPSHLGPTARYVDVRIPVDSSGVSIKDSSLEPITGANFHCWVDAPKLQTAATLDVDLVEVP